MTAQPTKFHAIESLKRVPPDVATGLVAPYRDALLQAGVGVTLSALTLLSSHDVVPAALFATVQDIFDLATGFGFAQVVEVAGRHGFELTAGALPVVTVAKLFLARPSLFQEAIARHSVAANRSFYEFVGRGTRAPNASAAGRLKLERALRSFFVARGLGDHCTILPWRERHVEWFLVRHGTGLHADQEIRDGDVVTREWWPTSHDLVAFDHKRGQIRVCVSNEVIRKEYLAGFGRWLFGDPEWFATLPLVNLDPLINDVDQALAPTTGVHSVKVRKITLHDRSPSRFSTTASDPIASLRARNIEVEPGEAQGARFILELADQRTVAVSIEAPNRITTDWRTNHEVVHGYLDKRGLLGGLARH